MVQTSLGLAEATDLIDDARWIEKSMVMTAVHFHGLVLIGDEMTAGSTKQRLLWLLFLLAAVGGVSLDDRIFLPE